MHIQDIVTFYIMELLVLLLILYSSFTSCAAEKRIIQGEDAAQGQFPYYAKISIESSASRSKCGAAIIHKRWLLSAAHCFDDPILNVSVAVGTNLNYGVNGQEYLVEKVIKHENFDFDKNLNDIALIRLKRDIRFSTNVQLITLPKDNFNKFDGASVTIPGMGATSTFGDVKPSILQFIYTEVIPLDQCRRMEYDALQGYIEDTKLCTSVKNGIMTCQGDSGGPVVRQGVLIGIVSYGYPICIPGSPDIHTRVSSYLDWIENTMNSYSDLLP